MAHKQQSVSATSANAAFLEQMKQKFAELKGRVASFEGVDAHEQPEQQPATIANEVISLWSASTVVFLMCFDQDALVQLNDGEIKEQKEARVEDMPNDDKVHASMLSQVEKLFEDGSH